MFLNMEGTVDDPKISYNTLRLRESLSDGLKKKKELRDIINNQFKNKINDNFIHDNQIMKILLNGRNKYI